MSNDRDYSGPIRSQVVSDFSGKKTSRSMMAGYGSAKFDRESMTGCISSPTAGFFPDRFVPIPISHLRGLPRIISSLHYSRGSIWSGSPTHLDGRIGIIIIVTHGHIGRRGHRI